jgi:hypothetical protein
MPGTSRARRRGSSATTTTRTPMSRSSTSSTCGSIQGSTHAFVLRDRPDGTEDGIADVYMEGTDQHRGWFHSSLLQACGTIGRAPYRNVVTHGFTLDEKGMKMSKSIGNTVVPEEVIEQYGADILRLWVAQADYTADQRIGPEILKGWPTATGACATRCGSCWGRWRISPRPTGWSPPRCRSWNAGCCTGWRSWTVQVRGRLSRLRLPGRVPGGVPVRHDRPVGLLLRHPQGRAVLRRRHGCGGGRRGRCWISCSTG